MHPSITEGLRARRSFVGRHAFVRHFADRLNGQPQSTILFLQGIAGSGKSLLTRYLHDRCCRSLKPDNWEYVAGLDDEEFVSQFTTASDSEVVPHAFVDFAMSAVADDRPREPFSALLMIRRQLGDSLPTPLFDFASLWYLKKTGQLSQERITKLFRGTRIDLAAALYDAITKTKVGAISKAFLGVVDKEIGEWATFRPYKRQISSEDLDEIQQLQVEGDLIGVLPELLGRDLGSALAQAEPPARVVLFFDSHESLVGPHVEASQYVRLQADEWLRQLLLHAPLGRLVAVIAGQNLPSWNTAARFRIPQTSVDVRELPLFSPTEASTYLARVGVDESDEHRLAIQIASVADSVHPLYLGLAADALRARRSRGETALEDDFARGPEVKAGSQQVLQRLLRAATHEAENAVRSLAVCRSFDIKLFEHLGEQVRFATTAAALEAITGLSVVSSFNRQGANWYQVHSLVGRLVEETDRDTARRAHTVLRQFYKSRLEEHEPAWLAEMIYHENRLTPKAGCDTWCAFFGTALNEVEYDTLRELLQLKPDLVIPDPATSGDVALLTARYYVKIGNWTLAAEQFQYGLDRVERALSTPKGARRRLFLLKGECLQGRADCAATKQSYAEAMKLFRQAISAYDVAIRESPRSLTPLMHKATTLKSRAEMNIWRGQYAEAIQDLRSGIEALDQALGSDCEDERIVFAMRSRADLQQTLASVFGRLDKYEDAKAAFEAAIQSFDLLLGANPDDIMVRHSKAIALSNLGDFQFNRGEVEEARAVYEESVAAAQLVADNAAEDILALNQLALNLTTLGRAQSACGLKDEARVSAERAIQLLDEVIPRAPDFAQLRTNASSAYCAAGVLEAEARNYPAAAERFQRAIDLANSALELTPDDAYGYNSRGLGEFHLAGVFARSGDLEQATSTTEAAIHSFEESLRIAPGYEKARRNLDRAKSILEQVRASHIESRDIPPVNESAER